MVRALVTWDALVPETVYGPFAFAVTDEAIRRYAQAVQDRNPIYYDEQAARRAGFPRLVAPPAFAAVLVADLMRRALGDRPPGGIHAGQRFAFRRPVYAGDRLETTARIAAKYERRGHKYVELAMLTLNQEQEPVLAGHIWSIWAR